MYEKIKIKNEEFGLSRMVSTFDYKHIKKKGIDSYVEIGDFKLPWNREYENETWAEKASTIDEIGSIYTVQGFDLNYVGVVIGKSIKKQGNKIVIDASNYKDKGAFSQITTNNNTIRNLDLNEVKEKIILNSLNILLKRGIKGLYIYFDS